MSKEQSVNIFGHQSSLGDHANTVEGSSREIPQTRRFPLTIADRRRTTVFPTSVSNAFAYTTAGYAARDTLDYDTGYWLKFPSTQLLSLTGGVRSLDTINVVQGWNIIGSISSPVPVASIVQIPGGIVVSQYFGYSGSAYAPAASINPMQGYWVKVSQNGRLVLPGASSRAQKNLTDRRK